jgi:hypothetical protein
MSSKLAEAPSPYDPRAGARADLDPRSNGLAGWAATMIRVRLVRFRSGLNDRVSDGFRPGPITRL